MLIAVLLAAGVFFASVYQELGRAASDDPRVWETEIVRFEEEARAHPPPADAILFVGSSSIRFWHTLAEDMNPLVTIRRGFGGSRMNDVVYYADRLITPYRPSKVVIFVGSNDINATDTPMEAVPVIADGLKRLVEIIHRERGDTEIYYIAITPTRYAWRKRAAVEAANAAAAALMAGDPRTHFIATRDLFLNADGEPDRDLFRLDGLHLNSAGYERWTQRIKPILTAD
jgi:lysophospholipase L1-like esterase